MTIEQPAPKKEIATEENTPQPAIKSLLSNKDSFEHLSKENPLLNKLKNTFDLEI